jgi:hypothetical protein
MPDQPPDPAAANALAEHAVGTLVRALEPGAFVTKFVAAVEVVDAHGQRVLWTLTHPGATAWDVNGLLEYVRDRERAGVLRG